MAMASLRISVLFPRNASPFLRRTILAPTSAIKIESLKEKTSCANHLHHVMCRCCTTSENIQKSGGAASAQSEVPTTTVFDKILAKEIPADIVYEDEKVLAFRDINPQAPVHILVIPKLRDGLTMLNKAEEKHKEILGHLLYAAKKVAEKEGIGDGFRVVVNNGRDACQSVFHLHLHVLGGRKLKWPPA